MYRKKSAENVTTHSLFTFPQVWHTVTYISGFAFFIPALLIIILGTNEIVFRTYRQNIIDGLSRAQYINTKFVLILILSAVCTVLAVITVLVFGFSSKGVINFEGGTFVFYFYIQCVCYSSMALLFAIVIKKTGMAIGSFVLYAWVLEKSVSGILNSAFKYNVGNYLPLSSSDKLIPVPFGDTLNKLNEQPSTMILFCVALIYLAAIYLLAYYKIQNEDIGN
nr:hypothetical protein [Mucilaginibacter sp. X4EP1]